MSLAVTVYSKPSCAQCDATKRHFSKIEIPYQDVPIDFDDDAMMASFDELGHTSAPIVVATTPEGDQDWSGYRPDRIEALKAFRKG